MVALQCDRPREGGRTFTVKLFGRPMPLPTGPAALARAAQVPILPVFNFRDGRFRVRTVARPPIRVPATADRDGDLAGACSVSPARSNGRFSVSHTSGSVFVGSGTDDSLEMRVNGAVGSTGEGQRARRHETTVRRDVALDLAQAPEPAGYARRRFERHSRSSGCRKLERADRRQAQLSSLVLRSPEAAAMPPACASISIKMMAGTTGDPGKWP